MIRKIFPLLWSILAMPWLHAQYYFYNDRFYEKEWLFEAGGAAGIMNCLTDLGGKAGIGKPFIKDLNWKNSRPAYSLYIAGQYQYKIVLKLEASFGTVHAYDSILKHVASSTYGRYERNLSFKSSITEWQLALEAHPLYFKTYIDKDPPRFSPYLLAGLGVFTFNPQAKLNDQWYDLQPLRLEGQGFAEYPGRRPYKLTQLTIPVGAGIKYEINSLLHARLEWVHRFLFTDYLDDVSTTYINPDLFANYLPPHLAIIAQQLHDRRGELNAGHIPGENGQRGNPGDKDAFFTIQLKIGFVFGRERRKGF